MITEEDMERIAQNLDLWPYLDVNLNHSGERELGERLEELKNSGKAWKDSKLVSLIDSLDYDGIKLSLNLKPGYHPALKEYGPDAIGPLLSIFGHLYGYDKCISKPEFYVFQVRGSKLPAPGRVQVACAGFVDWGEHPYQTAIRELQEEVLERIHIDSRSCYIVEPVDNRIKRVEKPKKILDFLPFKLKTGEPNPILSYVMCTESDNLASIPEVKIEDVKIPSQVEVEEEVAKIFKVRYDTLETFVKEIENSLGFYGPVTKAVENFLLIL